MKFIRVTIILLFNIFSIVQLQSQNNQSGVVVDEIIGRIAVYYTHLRAHEHEA